MSDKKEKSGLERFHDREEWVGYYRKPYKQLCPSCFRSAQRNSHDTKNCPHCDVRMVPLGYRWRVPRRGVSLKKWMKFIHVSGLFIMYREVEWGTNYKLFLQDR